MKLACCRLISRNHIYRVFRNFEKKTLWSFTPLYFWNYILWVPGIAFNVSYIQSRTMYEVPMNRAWKDDSHQTKCSKSTKNNLQGFIILYGKDVSMDIKHLVASVDSVCDHQIHKPQSSHFIKLCFSVLKCYTNEYFVKSNISWNFESYIQIKHCT